MEPSSEKPYILVADDDPIILQIVEHCLNSNGYQCEMVSDGEQAMAAFHKGKHDGMILDLMLPYMDGYTILNEIQEKAPDFPVIILSARSRDEDVLRGFDLGAADYLTKPFSPQQLIARLKRVLKVSSRRD